MNNYTTSKNIFETLSGAAFYQAQGAKLMATAQPMVGAKVLAAANQNATYAQFNDNQFAFTSTEKPVFTAFTDTMGMMTAKPQKKSVSARIDLVKDFGSNVVEFKKQPKTKFSYFYK